MSGNGEAETLVKYPFPASASCRVRKVASHGGVFYRWQKSGDCLLSRAAMSSAILLMLVAGPAPAQTEHMVVYGALPDSDIGLSADKIPGQLQSFGASQLTAQHGATVLNALGAQAAGVSLSNI